MRSHHVCNPTRPTHPFPLSIIRFHSPSRLSDRALGPKWRLPCLPVVYCARGNMARWDQAARREVGRHLGAGKTPTQSKIAVQETGGHK